MLNVRAGRPGSLIRAASVTRILARAPAQNDAQACVPPERRRERCSAVLEAASNHAQTTSPLTCARKGSSRRPHLAFAVTATGPSSIAPAALTRAKSYAYVVPGIAQPTTYCSVASPAGCQRSMLASASLTPAVVVSQTTAPDMSPEAMLA